MSTSRTRGSLLLVFLLVTCASIGTASPRPPAGDLVQRQVYLMGTRASLFVHADDRRTALDRLDRFIAVLEATEAQLSTWRVGTELQALNRAPEAERRTLTPSLCAVLTRVAHVRQDTRGAFDPAIGALVEAWGIGGRALVPSPAALHEARARSGFERLGFDPSTCTVTRQADVRIDSGAFGKGEALDRIRDVPRQRGLIGWLVDLGGQVAVAGRSPSGRGWPVAIAHPVQRDHPALEITLMSGSLSTSGGSERDQRSGGTRIGHILDPRTGRPAAFAGSVSVWHDDAFAADALSTALFVMGPDEGLQWANDRGIAACYLVPHEREARPLVRASRAFRKRFLAPAITRPPSS